MIAEDEAEIMTIYRIILSSTGYQVLETTDGQACIDTYKMELKRGTADQPPFDLVILDQRMPKKTGAQVAKEILSLSPNQRIVIITVYRDHPDFKAPELQKIQILEKPLDPDWLLEYVSKLVEHT